MDTAYSNDRGPQVYVGISPPYDGGSGLPIRSPVVVRRLFRRQCSHAWGQRPRWEGCGVESPRVPIILITGRYELVERLSAGDASSVLKKTVHPEGLLSVLCQKLGLH